MWNQIASRCFQPPNLNLDRYCVAPDYWTGDNLGDRPLNDFLLPKLFPQLSQVSQPKYILLGFGSLLGCRSCCMSSDEVKLPLLIYGSGYQYGQVEPLPEGSKVFCVRGKYTCKTFDLDDSRAVADPAILLPQVLTRDVKSIPDKVGRIYAWKHRRYKTSGKLRHFKTLKQKFKETKKRWSEDNCTVYTARTHGDFVGWMRQLWSCDKIETEAMHPAIIADAYGIPWKPLKWEQKWQDHFSMLGIAEKPHDFVLSDRRKLAEKTRILWQRRDELCHYVDSLEKSLMTNY